MNTRRACVCAYKNKHEMQMLQTHMTRQTEGCAPRVESPLVPEVHHAPGLERDESEVEKEAGNLILMEVWRGVRVR